MAMIEGPFSRSLKHATELQAALAQMEHIIAEKKKRARGKAAQYEKALGNVDEAQRLLYRVAVLARAAQLNTY